MNLFYLSETKLRSNDNFRSVNDVLRFAEKGYQTRNHFDIVSQCYNNALDEVTILVLLSSSCYILTSLEPRISSNDIKGQLQWTNSWTYKFLLNYLASHWNNQNCFCKLYQWGKNIEWKSIWNSDQVPFWTRQGKILSTINNHFQQPILEQVEFSF